MTKWLKEVGLPLLSVILLSAFPAVFLYCTNAGEASFSEAAGPLVLYCAAGVVLFLVITVIIKAPHKAALIANAAMLFFANFALLENIINKVTTNLRYWHCLLIVLFVLGHIAVLIYKKLPDVWAGYASRIICLVFGVLIAINGVTALPTIIKKVESEKALQAQRQEMLSQVVESEDYLPNIYYIILDEYSGFNTIKNVLGYDNDAFAEHLESLGFTVSRDSYNEYILTAVVTSNLMDLSYDAVNYIDDTQKLNEQRQNGELFQILREKGYQTQGVGASADEYGLERADAAQMSAGAQTMNGETLRDILYNQTAAYLFLADQATEKQRDILASFEFMLDEDNFPPQGMFTMMHVSCPHQPFLFDANGNSVPENHRLDWSDPKYYLGQFQYMTKCITEVINELVARDPNAVIILQSDHGARAGLSDMFGQLIPYEDMKNILNAVYIGGEPFEEMQGHSGVNTLRLLMNRMFGYDFEVLEVPRI